MRYLFAAVLAVFLCSNAFAQNRVCGPIDEISKRLKEHYSEMPVNAGLTGTNEKASRSVIILFTSPDNSWSIVEVNQKGFACLRAGGTSWGIKPPVPEGPGA